MWWINKRFIPLRPDSKQPLQSSPFEHTLSYGDADKYEDLAVVVPKGFMYLDFDNSIDADIALKTIEYYNVKTTVIKTDKGIHCWFKIPAQRNSSLKNGVNLNLAMGIRADVKINGKDNNVSEKVKSNGEFRTLLKDVELDKLDQLPLYFYPIKGPLAQQVINLEDGSGRDEAIYKNIFSLVNNGFKKNDLRVIIHAINRNCFLHPLTDKEIEYKIERAPEDSMKKEAFIFSRFGEMLILKENILTNLGLLYIYRNGRYVNNDNLIESRMLELKDTIRHSDRMEVLKYLKLKETLIELEELPEMWLNLRNGFYDMNKNVLIPHNKQYFSKTQLNVRYKENPYDEHVDKFLNDVSCNDKNLRLNLEELIGYSMYGRPNKQLAFILKGKGANGKSTFLEMVNEFIGEENISSLDLGELEDRFRAAEIVDKLVNIGSDISGKIIKDSKTFKGVTSGDLMTFERKFEKPFQYKPIVTLLFSANEIPIISDKTDAIYRRLRIIPFMNHFQPLMSFNINLFKSDSAKSYLLKLAVEGLKRLIKNDNFTQSDLIDQQLELFKVQNNTILDYIDDNSFTKEDFINKSTKEEYLMYVSWCALSHRKAVQQRNFTSGISQKFRLKTKPTTKGSIKCRIWEEEVRGE